MGAVVFRFRCPKLSLAVIIKNGEQILWQIQGTNEG